MNIETRLDQTHQAMQADLEDEPARLGFYGALADAEVFMLLEEEAGPDSIKPEILDLEGDRFALVFDSEARLADFTKEPAPYAALPGRAVAAMLSGQKIGLGLNLGVAPSSILIPFEAMDWLMNTLAKTPAQDQMRVSAILPVDAATGALLPALTDKLHFAGGLVSAVYLARFEKVEGVASAVLGVLDAPGDSHDALARAAQEALIFTGIEDQPLDVVFWQSGSKEAALLCEIGVEITLPAPKPATEMRSVEAPGSDPNKPPNLR